MAGKSRKNNSKEQPVIQNNINLNSPAKKSQTSKRKAVKKVSSKNLKRETEGKKYIIISLLVLIILIALYFLNNPDMLPGVHQGEGVRTISY